MLTLVPMLAVQRELYEMPRGRERFRKYLAVMTGGTDDMVLPLQAMNPMGREHVTAALDALIAVGAENIAADALVEAERRLGPVALPLRVGIVIADDVRGGWTNRELIEAHRLRAVPEAARKRGWLVVIYWASEPVSVQKVRAEVLAGIYRDLFLARHGEPTCLREMMMLEGMALAFAGAEEPRLDAEELVYTREVVRPYLDHSASEEFPTVFTCLFGDGAARRAGYAPLGLSPRAGCALALAEAQESPMSPEILFAMGRQNPKASSSPAGP